MTCFYALRQERTQGMLSLNPRQFFKLYLHQLKKAVNFCAVNKILAELTLFLTLVLIPPAISLLCQMESVIRTERV
jgi:hypothetical protein